MDKHGKHICMLPTEPTCMYYSPVAGWWRHLPCQFRELVLPCTWHHGSKTFLRSNKSLQLESKRQIMTAYPFILHPYSPVVFYWELFSLIVNSLTMFYVPVQVFIPCSDPYNKYVLVSDAVCAAGVLVSFITARVVENMNSVVFNPKDIAKGYIRSFFVVDVIGSLPLQIIQPFDNCNYPTHTLMYMFKLFRLPTMAKAWVSLHNQFQLSYLNSVAMTLVGRVVIFFHWAAYIHFQVPSLAVHFYESSQYYLIEDWLILTKVFTTPEEPSPSVLDKYVTNLYQAAGVCIGACFENSFKHRIIAEQLASSSLNLLGLGFIIYCLTCSIRLVIYANFERFLYHGRVKELQEYLNFKRIPQNLQQKIHLFINYTFNGYYFNERSITKTVNEQIRQDINMFCCRKLVSNVPLFQDLPVPLINMLIFRMTRLIYMPGEIVVKFGHPATSLYLIASGTVACVNGEGKEVAHLKDGAYFGEQALLVPGTIRTATVVALEITEIYKLTRGEFSVCMQTCPRLKWRLEQRHREEDEPTAPRGYNRPPAPLSSTRSATRQIPKINTDTPTSSLRYLRD